MNKPQKHCAVEEARHKRPHTEGFHFMEYPDGQIYRGREQDFGEGNVDVAANRDGVLFVMTKMLCDDLGVTGARHCEHHGAARFKTVDFI